ncbi:hypothetical protein V4C56_12155 [Paraburkholderia azotifigens]|uniref:TIR domain-containing protein n=1 Tax=Paraburkholderia azotifigens TaxID=2057004 RepID=A0ABU9R062_9BURK|nr:hypothetical protein [Paraburkholderia azotifigens]
MRSGIEKPATPLEGFSMRVDQKERTDDPPKRFYDVFLSYRFRDRDKVDGLQKKIESHGFTTFRDTDLVELDDRANVTQEKVEIIRRNLSRATCLIFAYSRAAANDDNSLGVWMPWELGFFDGSISSRIGVYLFDEKPDPFDARTFFKNAEYLQLYEVLTDTSLLEFLARNAVRERRIDNVESGFLWLQHLYEESLTNPTNVALGVGEWYADHASRFWRENGNEALAACFAELKVKLDDLRVSWTPQLRLRMFDALLSGSPDVNTIATRETAAKVGNVQNANPMLVDWFGMWQAAMKPFQVGTDAPDSVRNPLTAVPR